MHLEAALKLFKLLPTDGKTGGKTISQIVSNIIEDRNERYTIEDQSKLTRKIQHHMSELSELKYGMLVERIEGVNAPSYYLNLKNVAHWFMTEEAALNVILIRQIVDQYFGNVPELNLNNLSTTANAVIHDSSRSLKQVSNRVRIVSDGIGRLPAKINPQVLQSVFDAIGANKKIEMEYSSSRGGLIKDIFNPYGLVAKDGTIYLLACKNSNDNPWPYPLHRVTMAAMKSEQALTPLNFDLDAFIKKSHNLAHILTNEEQPVELVLKVESGTLYHFSERPISENQTIEESDEVGQFWVKATIPNTILLVPFLLSMGGWIEVVGPESVRNEMRTRLEKSLAHYLPA